MNSFPFVFSNQPQWRILRHVVFWFLWFVFQTLLYSFSPSPLLQNQSFLVRISITAPDSFIYLIPHLFLAYTLMYIVVSRFVINGKYVRAALISVLIFLVTAALSAILSITIIDYLRHNRGPSLGAVIQMPDQTPFYAQIGEAMMAGLRGSITIGGLAASIKLMKCFYEKEQTALRMEKEKVSVELQMLKAQLHPHFLFNTLNNIYSYTQNVSAVASNMIFGLSELLRYMLYECNQPFVPLDKELKMISDYIKLEKVRYDNHLDLSVNMPESSGRLRIAPLLLLPLVENCFKHGASNMISNPWISIEMSLNGSLLIMKLANGKNPNVNETHAGIGTINTQKRLDLIYNGKYEFQALEEADIYILNLKIQLDYTEPVPSVTQPITLTDESRKNIQLFNS